MIGSSTGGPGHIEKILKHLPTDPKIKIVIAQHMEPSLVDSFANRLNSICSLNVQAVDAPMSLEAGNIFICTHSTVLTYRGDRCQLEPRTETPQNYNPKIDLLFESAAAYADRLNILCILLTGIGDDGAKGMLTLKEAGARTIAEDASSAIVYGMPRSACELGAASQCLPLEKIIHEILAFEADYV